MNHFKTYLLVGLLLAAPAAWATQPSTSAAVKVPKATGANAYTVAEVVTKAVELKDKPVRVSGKVVKYNAAIMGKNWLHLQDGTGSASNNDILVTSTVTAKLGDIVTVSGIVRNDRDFGAGYFYKVLIEDSAGKP